MSRITGPRQVAIITCRNKNENRKIDNSITVAWHTQLSFEPFLYGIAIGKTRYSCDIIRTSKCFCVNFISAKLKQLALDIGRVSGRITDKDKILSKHNVKKIECKCIDCFRLDKAIAWLECEVIKQIDVGDHILFVGRVIYGEQTSQASKAKRLMHIAKDLFKEC